MKSSVLLLLALSLTFAACKNQQPPAEKDPPAATCRPVEQGAAPESDPVMSLQAGIADNCLNIRISYSGGCKDHEFRLFWNGLWAESMPPQTGLTLIHNANADHCRAIKTSEVSFDLSKVQYDGVNEVLLRLNANGAEEALSLNYKY